MGTIHKTRMAAPWALAIAVLGVPGIALAAPVGGYVAADWLPFGQAELAWVTEGRQSGTGAAETDGNLRAPLRLSGGPTFGRHAVLLSLSTWRETTTTWGSNPEDGSDLTTRVRRGGIRPGANYRWWGRELATATPLPYVDAGVYGVIPSVDYSSETWSATEQRSWDGIAEDDKTRIGGFGVSAGGGIEVRLDNGIALGARQSFVVHRGADIDDDQGRVSVLLRTETALTLGFVLPSAK
ncbi:MAG: hypothetical protein CL927_15915 [Deltaproteobacteria bacterium]|nr:hypothetical protein [Deltaproteobacteria bacterium]HCH62274.1 hypothetical protein [Deltaproteobacteria bacterium]